MLRWIKNLFKNREKQDPLKIPFPVKTFSHLTIELPFQLSFQEFAHHEAGHAVMARYFGVRTIRVSSKQVANLKESEHSKTPQQRAMIAYGGYVAHCIYGQRHVEPMIFDRYGWHAGFQHTSETGHPDGDYKHINEVLRVLNLSRDAQQNISLECLQMTEKILRHNWVVVIHVADAISQEEILNEARINELFTIKPIQPI